LQAAENKKVLLYQSLKTSKTGRQPADRWHTASNLMASGQQCASRQPVFCWQAASALMANSHRKNRWKRTDHTKKWVTYLGTSNAN
jgi:hypothetical protein